MIKLYIIVSKRTHHAFEDYIDSIIPFVKQYRNNIFNIQIIYYLVENDIPLPNSRDDIYLFISCIAPKFYKMTIDKKYHNIYVFNTEQLTRTDYATTIKQYITNGLPICDYDQYQTEIIRDTCDQVCYLPYQITKYETLQLNTLILQTEKLYDVAFCSTNKSKKRLLIYNQLINSGIKVIDVYGWKNNRDQKIAQAKILVNIHFDNDYRIFEHLRCDRWILSGMLVVTEQSDSDDMLDCRDLIVISTFDTIVDKIIDVVKNYDHYYTDYLYKLDIHKHNIAIERQQHLKHFINKFNI